LLPDQVAPIPRICIPDASDISLMEESPIFDRDWSEIRPSPAEAEAIEKQSSAPNASRSFIASTFKESVCDTDTTENQASERVHSRLKSASDRPDILRLVKT
jgi:hypothetical protein